MPLKSDFRIGPRSLSDWYIVIAFSYEYTLKNLLSLIIEA